MGYFITRRELRIRMISMMFCYTWKMRSDLGDHRRTQRRARYRPQRRWRVWSRKTRWLTVVRWASRALVRVISWCGSSDILCSETWGRWLRTVGLRRKAGNGVGWF
jgi:hypothetical protein